MKKALSLILALVLLLTLCACGKGGDQTDATGGTTGESVNDQTEGATQAASGNEGTTATTGDTTPQNTETTGATEGAENPKPTEGTKPVEEPQPTTPAHTHSWKDATCLAPKTCTSCGATEGAAAGHNYQNGTCTACGDKEVINHTFGTGTGYVVTLSSDGTALDCYQLGEEGLYYKTFFASKPSQGYYEIQEYNGKQYYCEAPSWGICPIETKTTSGRTVVLECYGETLKLELISGMQYKLTAGTAGIPAGLVFTFGSDRCSLIGHNSSVKCEGDVKCWECDAVLCAGFGHEYGEDDICFRCYEAMRPDA